VGSKFKAGDTVEWLGAAYHAAKAGALAVVQVDHDSRWDDWLSVKWDRTNGLAHHQMDGNYVAAGFKLYVKPKRKVYIAGPMTGIAEDNFPAFNKAAAVLKAAGLDVFNPADHGSGGEWAAYMKRDIPELLKCDAVVLLDGWMSSRGANLEYEIAESLEIPLYTYSEIASALELIRG
jgi:hypothetical protein